ncbi:MAG: hypothetical protein QOF60_3223 [Actinomycetota bacterium]|jgi:hypothetical protein|nr:hypothetical protein [Actinomycetota bacterium]
MGDALLIPFGLNLLSSTACEILVTRVRERLWPKRRTFAAAVSAHLRRAAALQLKPSLVEHVLFDGGAFRAVLRGVPAPSTWDNLLFDLLSPGGITADHLATLLYDAIVTQGGLEIQMCLAEGINDLKDGQWAIYNELLELRSLVERSLSESAHEAATVHPSINDHLANVHMAIGALTAEQVHVIRTLHGVRRALVPGTAGSGKTVVACEKAMRLADAGVSTLLLCHNPLLARHLEDMTRGSRVEVQSFGEWVAVLAGDSQQETTAWQRYDEPSEQMLLAALERLIEDPPGWQAVVVDEGQDFRTNWWLLVDAAVDSPGGLLYVFADDQQQIHGADRQYPVFDQTYMLSRNCRNSGPVYAAMRTLVAGLSRHEDALAHLGSAVVVFTGQATAKEGLGRAAQELHGTSATESVVVLTMDGQVEVVRAANPRILTAIPLDWRAGVARAAKRVVEEAKSHTWYTPGGSDDVAVLRRLDELSHEATPREADAQLVAELANLLIARTPKLDWTGASSPVRFVAAHGEVTITRNDPRHWQARVKYLASKAWTADFAPPASLALKAYAQVSPASAGFAAVHTVAGFKGLEADTVLVVWDPQLSPDPLTELYVAVSRARLRCIIVAPSTSKPRLPARMLATVRVVELEAA